MAKADNHIARKKSKVIRKRNRRAGADSLEAIKGVQAAKRRRQHGTRRGCEGMCYSLPTPEDPFNEKSKRTLRRKGQVLQRSKSVEELHCHVDDAMTENRRIESAVEVAVATSKPAKEQVHAANGHCANLAVGLDDFEKGIDVLSEYQEVRVTTDGNGEIINCVHNSCAAPDARRHDCMDKDVLEALSEAGISNVKSKLVRTITNALGRHFWKAFHDGLDVLALTPGICEDVTLAYVVPAAAHIQSQKSGIASLRSPLVLILVASQQQAFRVRTVFKPLRKILGIRSVSIHSCTSMEHQIKGLTMQMPEIVVAVPDRLCELLVQQAITLSTTTFLVVDSVDEVINQGFQEQLRVIKENLPKSVWKLISTQYPSDKEVTLIRKLLQDPISRVAMDTSVESLSACITQNVSVFTSADKKLSKLVKLLQHVWENEDGSLGGFILIVVKSAETVQKLLPVVQGIGFCTIDSLQAQLDKSSFIGEAQRKKTLQAVLATENVVLQLPLDSVRLVLNYDFPSIIRIYHYILTGMARNTVHGLIHSFFTPSNAQLSGQLMHILRTCSQHIPRGLQMLADAASLVQKQSKD